MTGDPKVIPNPDLAVGAGNKQRWNQPQHRRWGFTAPTACSAAPIWPGPAT